MDMNQTPRGTRPRPMDDQTQDKKAGPEATRFDVEAFSRNLARVIEQGGQALAAYLKPREEGKVKDGFGDDLAEIVATLARVLEYWLSDPQRAAELQSR